MTHYTRFCTTTSSAGLSNTALSSCERTDYPLAIRGIDVRGTLHLSSTRKKPTYIFPFYCLYSIAPAATLRDAVKRHFLSRWTTSPPAPSSIRHQACLAWCNVPSRPGQFNELLSNLFCAQRFVTLDCSDKLCWLMRCEEFVTETSWHKGSKSNVT